jgi:hypothetical protein
MEPGRNPFMKFDVNNTNTNSIIPKLNGYSDSVVISPHQGTTNNESLSNGIIVAKALTTAGIEGANLDQFQRYVEQIHDIEKLTMNDLTHVINSFKKEQIKRRLATTGATRVYGGKKKKTIGKKKSKTTTSKSKKSQK